MRLGCQAYVDVYQVVDDVRCSGSCPAGARGILFTAIDKLRCDCAPRQHIEIAERISVALHRLEWAMLRRDENEASSIREELEMLSAQWHQIPIPASLN
jgi:hypothetical protein